MLTTAFDTRLPPYRLSPPTDPLDRARRLAVEADAELSAGHYAAAERLAWRAADLRGAVQ